MRTEVAVGTSSEASMFVARAFDIPLRMLTWSASSSIAASSIVLIRPVTGAWAGIGCGLASTRVVLAITCSADAELAGAAGAAGVTGVAGGAGVAG